MRILLLLVLSSVLNVVNVQDTFAQNNLQITGTTVKSYNGSNVSCATANDGEITVTATGGSGQYEYSKNEQNSWQTGNVFTGLVNNATYGIFVRDIVTKQVTSGTWVTLNHINPVTISSPLQVISQPKCFSSADGIISITAYGGTGTLNYSIDNGNSFQNSNRFEGLKAGTYRVYIKDANGCTITSNAVTLQGPPELNIQVSALTNATCANPLGSITFRGTGSTGDYNYSIDGQPFFWKSKNDFHTFSNLAMGKHQILIMNNYNQCLFAYNFEITNPLFATLSAPEIVCKGENLNLTVKIAGRITSSQAMDKYTATFRDDKMTVFTKTDLVYGLNVISLGQLERLTTFTLISVKSQGGCLLYIADEVSNVTIKSYGTWLGFDSDWHNPNNWPCGLLPDNTTDVFIGQTANNPVIKNATGFLNNLSIAKGSSLKVIGLLKMAGEIKNMQGEFDVTEGTLEFNSANGQTINGSSFKSNTIRNLIVSNNTGLKIDERTGDTLNITGGITFGTPTASLITGDNITLKSSIDGTANMGVIGTENAIKGKFIVERYINTGTDKTLGQHGKAWMLLSTPTIGSSIFESWQEGGKATGKTPIANNNKGYGTLLTTGYNKVPANGFDLYTGAGSSIKTYDSKTNSYDKGPVNTYDPIYNEKGYLVMVRGDRSIFTSNAAAIPVVLRTKGELITGTTKEIKVAAGKWESIGNPYASRIYLDKIERTGGVDEFITVWDPKLGGSYGLGAFQTLVNMGSDYMAIPGGGSYGRSPVTFIESGQAFFVQATKEDGSVYFTEDAKIPSKTSSMGRGSGKTSANSYLRTSLYALGSGEAILADGNILLTGNYSNGIDGMDARKMANSAENFSILSSGNQLAVESRQIISSDDTLFFTMSGMRAQDYQLQLTAQEFGLPGMQAWLVDAFTGISTPLNLNGSTEIKFTVSNKAGSASANRFMIVFKPAIILPVTFSEVKATLIDANVLVEWSVEAESNLHHYSVEKSLNGTSFSEAAIVAADKTNGGKYQWLDNSPAEGYNYYRIRSVDRDGKTSFTQIVKVQTGSSVSSISVYPNPVVNGVLNVKLGNQPEGVYNLRLLNPVGQVLSTTKINHVGGHHTEKLNWDHSMPKGMYTLEISNVQTGVKIIKIMY